MTNFNSYEEYIKNGELCESFLADLFGMKDIDIDFESAPFLKQIPENFRKEFTKEFSEFFRMRRFRTDPEHLKQSIDDALLQFFSYIKNKKPELYDKFNLVIKPNQSN